MKTKVLWIEDGARNEVEHFLGPLYADGNFSLTLAEDATDGMLNIERNEYSVVIVDILLMPGDDERWWRLCDDKKENKGRRIGLELLRTMLGSDKAIIKLAERKEWLKPDIVGVISVEGDSILVDELNSMGIKHYVRKDLYTPRTALRDMVRSIASKRI
jgi:hypothetical protein